jgi:hypothetical protein
MQGDNEEAKDLADIDYEEPCRAVQAIQSAVDEIDSVNAKLFSLGFQQELEATNLRCDTFLHCMSFFF